MSARVSLIVRGATFAAGAGALAAILFFILELAHGVR